MIHVFLVLVLIVLVNGWVAYLWDHGIVRDGFRTTVLVITCLAVLIDILI